jgi:apolipoprotein N-acyltransferase
MGHRQASRRSSKGGVPSTGLGFGDERREVLRRHVSATLALADAVQRGDALPPDFVVWPENSSDIDPLADEAAAAQIDTAARAIGVPILVGAVLGISETTVANVGIVWDPITGRARCMSSSDLSPSGSSCRSAQS